MEMHFAGPPGCLVRLQKTTCCGARRTARFWVHAAQPLRPGMQVRRLEQVSIGTDRPTKNRGLVRGILHSRRFNRTLGFAHSCIRSRHLAENWCIRRYQRGLLSSQQPVDLSHVLSGRCMVLHGFAWHTCEETCCHTCKETCCHACEEMWHAMRTQHMHVRQEHAPLEGREDGCGICCCPWGGLGDFLGRPRGVDSCRCHSHRMRMQHTQGHVGPKKVALAKRHVVTLAKRHVVTHAKRHVVTLAKRPVVTLARDLLSHLQRDVARHAHAAHACQAGTRTEGEAGTRTARRQGRWLCVCCCPWGGPGDFLGGPGEWTAADTQPSHAHAVHAHARQGHVGLKGR